MRPNLTDAGFEPGTGLYYTTGCLGGEVTEGRRYFPLQTIGCNQVTSAIHWESVLDPDINQHGPQFNLTTDITTIVADVRQGLDDQLETGCNEWQGWTCVNVDATKARK